MEIPNKPCEKHAEQIKNLNKRLDEVEKISQILHSLDKNYALQSQVMQHMTARNDAQDARSDKQDKRMEEQQEIILKVGTNLNELAEGQRFLNQGHKALGEQVRGLTDEVANVKDAQVANEKRQTIHTGELLRDTILKYAIPVGIIGSIVALIIKALL